MEGKQQTCCKTSNPYERAKEKAQEQNRLTWYFHWVLSMEISTENIGILLFMCFCSSWKKIICPSASVWHPPLLARIFNYKLTISESHEQMRLKQTQHGDEGFSRERQTNHGFTLTIRPAVRLKQWQKRHISFNTLCLTG